MSRLTVHMKNSGLDSYLTFGDEIVPGVNMVMVTEIDDGNEIHISAIFDANEVNVVDEKDLEEENEELKKRLRELESYKAAKEHGAP